MNRYDEFFQFRYAEVEQRVQAEDNLMIRVKIPALFPLLMERKGDSGYFFEYDCESVSEPRAL